MAETIVIAILSSGALSALITGLFQLIQTRKSRKTGLESKVDALVADQEKVLKAQKKQEADSIRIELKLMIASFPDDESDILRLAEHYFRDLRGNWVMATTFKAWLKQRQLELPSWFDDEI